MKNKILSIVSFIIFCFTQSTFAQWTTPAIDAVNDGAGNYPNNYSSGATNWALTWNNTDLFVCINNANQSEPVSIYLDVDPMVPVNGGTDANGTLMGLNYDAYTTPPNLPFRADICIYAHNGYREILRRDGANGWTSLGGGGDGICGGGTNDYAGNSNGQYASNDNGNGNGGDDRREFKISWSRLQGAINGGALPAAFNWMGYISYSNGMYAQVPVENYNGNNVIANSNGLVRYFTVSNTGNGTATNPFSQNSFTQPLTASNVAFGAISVYDFTINSNAQSITRTAGAGQAWNISGTLVIANGTIDGGSSSTAINTKNLDLRGGSFILSSSVGGDFNIAGNFVKTAGTFNCNGRQVNFNGTTAQSYTTDVTQTINYLLISNTSANVTSSSSIIVPNNLTINSGANCRLDMGANTLNVTGSSGNIINGYLRIGGTGGSIVGMTALNTTFSATGTYEHNYTTVSGTIPSASWNATSNCNIIGYTSNTGAAGGLAQTFGNFNWNCTAQTGNVNLFGGLNGATIAGNFNVMATNSGSLRLTSFASMTLTILGNLNVSGGTFALTNAISPNAPNITLNITGAINITGGITNLQVPPPATTGGVPTFIISAASFNISAGSMVLYNATTGLGSTATFNISGNFTQSGGTINNCSVGAANGIIANWNVNGNFTQTAGTFTGATFGTNPEIYLNVKGDFNQSLGATITAGAVFPKFLIEFNGAANQNVSLAGSALNNLWWCLNNAAGITLATNININSIGKFIRTSGNITGSGGIVYAPGSQLRYNGIVNMTSSDKEWPASMTSVSVEIDNAAGINLHNSRTATGSGGEVRLTSGSLFLGNNDLFIDYNNNGNFALSSPSATNMFVTNGTGQFKLSIYVRSGSPVGFDNYVFPIGDNTGTAEYTPAEMRFYKNTVSRIIGVRVIDAVSPNMNTPGAAVDYLSRYWLVTENSAGGIYRDSISVYYTPADVNGTETNMKMSTFAAGTWTEHGTSTAVGVKMIGFQPSTAAFTQAYLPLNGLEITGRKAPVFTNYTWVGTTSNDYNTATNWSPNGIPGAADNITVGVAAPNPCVINSGNFTVSNFTLNGTGNFQLASGTSITVNGTMSYGGTATGNCNCNSTFIIAGGSASTVPPINYGNLNLNGGNRTLSSTGTIGICGTYNPGTGVITITGSTVNFNGNGAQTIPATSFNNLSISNARTTTNITLSGVIDVAGTFNPIATFTSGNYITTGNTINYNGPNGQTIVAFNYNNLSSSNNNRVLQSTGNIGIAGVFVPGTGTYTTTGSTVVFNGSANQTIPVFNSVNANRSYHHLTIEGTGLHTPSRTWGGAGITNGITGNLNLNGGQFEQSTTAGTVTFIINGNLNLNSANARFSQHSGNLSDNITTIFGDFIQTAGNFDFNTSAAGTGDGMAFLHGNLNATTGLITTSSTGSNTINPSFIFDGSGTQNYNRSAGSNSFVDFIINGGKSVLLQSNLTVTDGDFEVGASATLDAQGFTIVTTDVGASIDELKTNASSLIRTTHTNGIVGLAPSGNRNFNINSYYEFYGSNQITGFSVVPAISQVGKLIMSLSGTLTNGTAALTINNALELNSGSLQIGAANVFNMANTAVVTAVAGDFIVGANAGTINFIGSGSFTGSSNPYNVFINGGVNFGVATVTIQNGGKLRINAGGFVNTNAPAYASGAILQYNSGGNYGRSLEWSALSGKGYPFHVQVSNGTSLDVGNATPAVARVIAGDLTIDAGAGFYLDFGVNDMTSSVTVNGDLNLAGNLSLSSIIGGDLILLGDWNHTSGVFNPQNRAVFFQGNVGDQVVLNPTTETFDYLIINKTAGKLILSTPVNVRQSITLSNGLFDLNGNELTLGQVGTNGSLIGGNASNYFISGASSAKFTRFTTTTATTYQFPLGDASNYTPINITLNSGTSVNNNATISVYLVAAIHPLIGVPGADHINRYWSAEPLNFGGTFNYDVNYSYATADIVGVEANLKPYKYHAGTWVSCIGSGFPSNMGTATLNPGTNTIVWNGLTTFSDFTGNGNGSPLPITLLSFEVQPILEHVLITWATASEINNDFFTVERSNDGVHFDALLEIDGAGNSNQTLQYKATDFMPYKGISYYRLKQTDFDGNYFYSNIIAVEFNENTQTLEWNVFPNPTNLNGVYIANTKTANMSIKLVDITGKTVLQTNTINDQNNTPHFVSFDGISNGMYLLELNDGNKIMSQQLLLNQ